MMAGGGESDSLIRAFMLLVLVREMHDVREKRSKKRDAAQRQQLLTHSLIRGLTLTLTHNSHTPPARTTHQALVFGLLLRPMPVSGDGI